MDYSSQPLTFKVRKVARYCRLYGPSLTLAKVRAERHMSKGYRRLPYSRHINHRGTVGILGAGKFAYSHIAYFLKRHRGAVIRGVMDPHLERAASLMERYECGYYTDDSERVIYDPSIRLIYIASNHASHADYAIRALKAGKSVHIEKPHVVSDEQLEQLCGVMTESDGLVALGFNRPDSRIGRCIRGILDTQNGPLLANWFVAGHEIPEGHWYYRTDEGGRVLGNLCHWTDFNYHLVPKEGRFPIQITPVSADKKDCDIAVVYRFRDSSLAAITFSAKGHAFEGVKERFAAHKADALITMDDFQHMTIQLGSAKRRVDLRRRDHGQCHSILRSYDMVHDSTCMFAGASVGYVWETAQLFLRTREALESDKGLSVFGYTVP